MSGPAPGRDQPPGEALLLNAFWFETLAPEQWFRADPEVDRAVRTAFGDLYERFVQFGTEDWEATPDGALAAVLGFDQLPRNLFRGQARAFATDERALALAERAIARGFDQALPPQRRMMLYMPFQHSEDRAIQARSVALFEALGEPRALDFARRHQAVIERFGRFPHRNAALGRASTAEETTFLAQPGSPF